MSNMHFEWNGPKVLRKWEKDIQQRLTKVALLFERLVKKNLSRGNLTGLNPSKAGQFPKVVTGQLRASIRTKVKKNVAFIGTFTGVANKYAPIHEFGSRPYLSKTYRLNKRLIKQIMIGQF